MRAQVNSRGEEIVAVSRFAAPAVNPYRGEYNPTRDPFQYRTALGGSLATARRQLSELGFIPGETLATLLALSQALDNVTREHGERERAAVEQACGTAQLEGGCPGCDLVGDGDGDETCCGVGSCPKCPWHDPGRDY